MKFKKCLQFEQSVVEKLPSYVKLVSPFRKPTSKSALVVRFVVSLFLHICMPLEEFLGCMVVAEMPGM